MLQTACNKLVDIPEPINTITDEAVFSTDATAAAVLTGLYVNMSQARAGGFCGIEGIGSVAGLSSDELFLSAVGSLNNMIFFQNNLAADITIGGGSWAPMYNYIYRCNAAVEGITSSKNLTNSVKQQLLGEARFLRAFCYFHLVNLFGPVPLATTIDYKRNALLPRASESEVYKFIIDDLKIAQNLLSEQYLNGGVNAPTIERVRPTKWAATSLLARVYLYTGDYASAVTQSSMVINAKNLFNLLPLNEVFLKNSREAIWQLQPTEVYWNTVDARVFIIPAAGFSGVANPFYLNSTLLNSFESGDQRNIVGNWIGEIVLDATTYYYSYKYKDNNFNPDINPDNGARFMTEYFTVFRLAEQYLIRSEALAQQGKLGESIKDLDSIRFRCGLPLIADTYPSVTKADLLEVILHERQVELFTEWGHRWFDLKRTGRVESVMSKETMLKGGTWNSREALYPIPQLELQRSPNIKQNPGYPSF